MDNVVMKVGLLSRDFVKVDKICESQLSILQDGKNNLKSNLNII